MAQILTIFDLLNPNFDKFIHFPNCYYYVELNREVLIDWLIITDVREVYAESGRVRPGAGSAAAGDGEDAQRGEDADQRAAHVPRQVDVALPAHPRLRLEEHLRQNRRGLGNSSSFHPASLSVD